MSSPPMMQWVRVGNKTGGHGPRVPTPPAPPGPPASITALPLGPAQPRSPSITAAPGSPVCGCQATRGGTLGCGRVWEGSRDARPPGPSASGWGAGQDPHPGPPQPSPVTQCKDPSSSKAPQPAEPPLKDTATKSL